MVYSDTTNKQGIVQMIYFLCGLDPADTTSYSIEDITRNVNAWYRTVNTWIWAACGDWNYDDSNYNNQPIAVNNLKANQIDYSLPDNYFNIERVEVLDANGLWRKVEPITKEMIGSRAMDEFMNVPSIPKFYELTANSIKFYPASDSDRDGAIQLYLARDVSQFLKTDTNKSPGFNVSFHQILAYGAAFDYVLSIGQVDKIKMFKQIINEYEIKIKEYYAVRNREMRPRLIPRVENYR